MLKEVKEQTRDSGVILQSDVASHLMLCLSICATFSGTVFCEFLQFNFFLCQPLGRHL